jgi:hypothetical protein
MENIMNEENVEANNTVSPSSKLAEGLGAGLIANGLEYPQANTNLAKCLGAGLVPVRELENSITELVKGLSDPKLQKLTDGLGTITSESSFMPEAIEAVKSMKLHGSELGKRALDYPKHEIQQAVFIPEYCPKRSISMETLADSIAEVSAKLDRLLESQGL